MHLSGILAEKGLHAFDHEPRVHDGVVLPRLWLVVADREEARIYRKTEKGIECIAKAKTGHSKSHPEASDSGGAVMHGYDIHSRKRQDGDTAFIRKLTEWLDEAEKNKTFDNLVIVAAPRTLGDIRSTLSEKVRGHVKAEVDKDLIKLSDREIEERLSNTVFF